MEWQHLRRADFDFWSSMRSRWRDMDTLGHINHAAYLTYMESARVDVYFKLGYRGIRKDEDESTILGSMEVNYHHQATHPSQLEIGHRISRV
ncbi:MAG: acyl-CoA thioesterase, partial [Candidatus Neomarinimicrobiota bacterium]|nr:acyl-CoA thioesterase [Candidatus Neomarinimicrobiota bacterium]